MTAGRRHLKRAGYHAFNWLEASFGGTARFHGEDTTHRRSMLAGMVFA